MKELPSYRQDSSEENPRSPEAGTVGLAENQMELRRRVELRQGPALDGAHALNDVENEIRRQQLLAELTSARTLPKLDDAKELGSGMTMRDSERDRKAPKVAKSKMRKFGFLSDNILGEIVYRSGDAISKMIFRIIGW